MKRLLAIPLLTAALTMGASIPATGEAAGEVKVSVKQLGERKDNPLKFPGFGPAGEVSTADVLVNENFEKFVLDEDYEFPLAINEPGIEGGVMPDIDPNMMHGLNWTGNWVYAGDRECILRAPLPYQTSYVQTPYGDYSGSLKITFLARQNNGEWNEGELEGATISLVMYNKNTNSSKLLAEVRMYEGQGWTEVTVEFDNDWADNGIAMRFVTMESVALDDIRITTSMDKFLASPELMEITDKTETSFTINFQPVRKAYTYFIYLYTYNGVNEETGDPIFLPVLDPLSIAEAEEFGMTIEEYLNYCGYYPPYEQEPYIYYDYIDRNDPTTYTFTGLDPAEDYFYCVRSQFLDTYSSADIAYANYVAAPVTNAPSSITDNSFTASWNPVVKANSYEVTLYGVNKVMEDDEEYPLLYENFDNASAFTDATDIYDPLKVNEESGLTMDDLTDLPGWDAPIGKLYLVEGMVGVDETNPWLKTPKFHVGGNDKIRLHLCAESYAEKYTIYLMFNNVPYRINSKSAYYDGVVEIPTNGVEEGELWISGPDFQPLFIDEVLITQSLKAGDSVNTKLKTVDKLEECSYSFDSLDAGRFDFYGYAVRAIKSDEDYYVASDFSEVVLVDLANGTSPSGVTGVQTATYPLVETERYSIDGRKIYAPEKGVNIVRYNDGSTKKIIVR